MEGGSNSTTKASPEIRMENGTTTFNLEEFSSGKVDPTIEETLDKALKLLDN